MSTVTTSKSERDSEIESNVMSASLSVSYEILVEQLPSGYGRLISHFDEEMHVVTFRSGYHLGQDIPIAKVVVDCGWKIKYPTQEVFE